jgi:hypothetical protein
VADPGLLEEASDYLHVSYFPVVAISFLSELLFFIKFFFFFTEPELLLGLRPRLTPAELWRREGPPFPLVLAPSQVPPPPSSTASPGLVTEQLLVRRQEFHARTTARERVLNAR